MAKNALQDGRVIDHTLSADCASGDVIVVSTLVGIALSGGKTGDTIALQVTGVWSLPRNAEEAFTAGQRVQWVGARKRVEALGTTAPGSVNAFGLVLEASAAGTDPIKVLLTPGAGFVQSG